MAGKTKNDRPPYQPWYEGDFWTLRVRTMHPVARLMFRSVLQAAWDLNPPCQIPNSPETIKAMADCWHQKIWEKHGPAVMSMFDASSDGAFMTNARQLQELANAYAKTASYRARGKKGGRPSKEDKPKKTKQVKKAEVKDSFDVAFSQQSNQPNPTQPNINNKSVAETSSAPKPESRLDGFYRVLKNYWRKSNDSEFEPTGAFWKNFHSLLRTKKSWTAEYFAELLVNRMESEGVTHSDPPEFWITSIEKYAHGPLDRFNKLKATA